jgi:hypothetical protein
MTARPLALVPPAAAHECPYCGTPEGRELLERASVRRAFSAQQYSGKDFETDPKTADYDYAGELFASTFGTHVLTWDVEACEEMSCELNVLLDAIERLPKKNGAVEIHGTVCSLARRLHALSTMLKFARQARLDGSEVQR